MTFILNVRIISEVCCLLLELYMCKYIKAINGLLFLNRKYVYGYRLAYVIIVELNETKQIEIYINPWCIPIPIILST